MTYNVIQISAQWPIEPPEPCDEPPEEFFVFLNDAEWQEEQPEWVGEGRKAAL